MSDLSVAMTADNSLSVKNPNEGANLSELQLASEVLQLFLLTRLDMGGLSNRYAHSRALLVDVGVHPYRRRLASIDAPNLRDS